MGYTHYWKAKGDFTLKRWRDFSEDAEKLLAEAEGLDIKLVGNIGQEIPPIVNEDEVCFIGDPGCETFFFDRFSSRHFEFCKTSRDPYDLIVCGMLVLMKKHFGKSIVIQSDGGPSSEKKEEDSEWNPVHELMRRLFSVEFQWVLNEDKEHELIVV